MGYFEALKMFGVENGKDINEEGIKKKYRKLVKEYHPDCCGNDEMYKKVQDAYKDIKLYIAAVKEEAATMEEKKRSYTIELGDLLNIFKGKVINVGNSPKLDRDSLNTFKVFVKIVVNVSINGVISEYSFIKPRNIKDEYSVEIIINDADFSKPLEVYISVLDKKINSSMDVAKMNFRFNMDYISQVNVSIHRVLLEEQWYEIWKRVERGVKIWILLVMNWEKSY